MNMQLQHYLVYLIVGATAANLLRPALQGLAWLLPKNRRLKQDEPTYSAYDNVCDKCTIKNT